MIQILLADTDQDNLKNIRNYTKKHFTDMRVTGVVANQSRDIFATIRETAADLIIADIRFFGAAGYITLRRIHEQFSDVRFILYGSYADSEYLKNSKAFGVLDFLFKPVRPAELSRCLYTVRQHFKNTEQEKKESRQVEDGCKEQLCLFKDIFLKELLRGGIRNETEIHRSFEYFDMDFHQGFTVLMLRIAQFSKLLLTLTEMEKHLLSYRLILLTEDALKGYPTETSILGFHEVAVIVGGFEDLDEIITLCETLKNNIVRRTQITVTIGVGRTYENAADICVSCREAQSALRYRFHIGENAVIPIHYMEPSNSITYRYPMDKEARLVSTAVIGEYDYCHVLLIEIFDALRKSEPLPDKFLPKLAMNILISISRYLSEKSIPTQFTRFFSSKEALELNDIETAFQYLDDALKSFCQFILDYHDGINLEIIKAAKDYCHEHYHESISQAAVAKSLDTTPEYLNRLFLDKDKVTFQQYAVGARLDEAKRLMRESDLNDDMVAVKVGYEDGRYFRGVFRQYEGVDTSDYRAQYGALSSRIAALRSGSIL